MAYASGVAYNTKMEVSLLITPPKKINNINYSKFKAQSKLLEFDHPLADLQIVEHHRGAAIPLGVTVTIPIQPIIVSLK